MCLKNRFLWQIVSETLMKVQQYLQSSLVLASAVPGVSVHHVSVLCLEDGEVHPDKLGGNLTLQLSHLCDFHLAKPVK